MSKDLIKKCSKCDKELPFACFYKKSGGKFGLASRCKDCEKERTNSWATCNRERRRLSYKKWYLSKEIKNTRKFKQKELFAENKKECSRCKEKVDLEDFHNDKKSSDGKTSSCKKCMNKCNSDWAKRNKDKSREKSTRHRKKREENAIHARMSNAIWRCLKNEKANSSWLNFVDYSVKDLKERLESQFTDGMNWDAFMSGEIHIDHIVPKSWFNFTSPQDEEFIKCWSLDNLQPLWAKENCSKSNRYAGSPSKKRAGRDLE